LERVEIKKKNHITDDLKRNMTKESAAISPATLPATFANTVRRVGVGLRAR
jgi:hypothetical protein